MRIKFNVGDKWQNLCYVATEQDADMLVTELSTKCDVRFKVTDF